jgi:hypothetical protein
MRIFKNINLLNTILLAMVIIIAQYQVIPLLEYKPDFSIDPKTYSEKMKNSSESENEEEKAKKGDLIINPGDISSYSVIAEQNLFHPERKIVIVAEKKKEAPPKEEEAVTTEFILYGTIVADDIRIAFMEGKVIENTPQRQMRRRINTQKKEEEPEKKKKRFRVGDTVEGYTLKEINTENVVLAKGDEVVTVKVYDPENPKKRQSIRSTTASKRRITQPQRGTVTSPQAQKNLEQKKEQIEKRRKVQERLNRYRRARSFPRSRSRR